MSQAPVDEDVFDQFLSQRGYETSDAGWEDSYNKKQCPDCGGLHEPGATQCKVCGWSPV